MARASQPGAPASSGIESRVEFAEKVDCEEILALVEQSFDRYGEQLPTRHEVEAAVQSRQILITKREGVVAGLLFFETQGLSFHVPFLGGRAGVQNAAVWLGLDATLLRNPKRGAPLCAVGGNG